MSTLVHFSSNSGDYVQVKESQTQVVEAILGQRGVGLEQLTRTNDEIVHVNPARIAFLADPVKPGRLASF